MADARTASPNTSPTGANDGSAGARLSAMIARIAGALPAPQPGSHIVMAFETDREAFLAALLATWTKGHAAVLPVDARRHSVAPALARPDVVLLAHDTGVGMGLDVSRVLAAGPGGDDPTVDPARVGAVTCVGAAGPDGSTAAHTWSSAEVSELLVSTLERMALPRDAVVWNAFAPAVPCALLPGLLAPLHAGVRVMGEPLRDAADVAHGIAAAGAHTLIAPAALLRRLAHLDLEMPSLVQAFAVDGPLDARTIALLAAKAIRATSLPTIAPPGSRDAASDALVARLLALTDVEDAAAEPISGVDGIRHCCVVATARSADTLRRELSIGDTVDLRCLPMLPRESDDRLPRDVLLRLCERNADGATIQRELSLEPTPGPPGTHAFRALVPAAFFAFAGHFTTYPVLSGAVQLHELVLPCLRRVVGAHATVAAFLDLKFLARIGPGDTVDVLLRVGPTDATAEFEIVRGGTKCSSGRMKLRQADRENAP